MVKVKQGKRWLAWVPAMLVIAGSIVTAAGISVIPMAGAAATDTATVNVTGTVGDSIAFGTACGGASMTFTSGGGNGFTQGGSEQISADCPMGWSTNAANGSKIEIADNAHAGTPFFCHAVNGCGAGSNADNFDDTASTYGTLATGEFGVALESTSGTAVCSSGCASAGWTTDADTAVAAGDGSFYAITDTDTKVCGTSAPSSNASCVMVFGGEPKASQNAGNYSGQVIFTATTL